MNGKIQEILNRYLVVVLVFLPVIFLIRLILLLDLTFFHASAEDTYILVLHGFLVDIVIYFSYSLLLFIPYILISLLNKKAGSIFLIVLFILYSLLGLLLEQYFTQTMVPLDQVIFSFSLKEIRNIVLSSVRINFLTAVAFAVAVLIPVITWRLIRKWKMKRIFLILFSFIILSTPILFPFVKPQSENYQSNFEYFVISNKVEYFISRVIRYNRSNMPEDIDNDSYRSAIKRYHFRNPEFTYTNAEFPLLRNDQTPDVLGSYFQLKEEKPNLVFIIVESLSTSFCGKDPYYGSFMPFLDSLIGQSLYWNNFLATSERTFNVLPAVFGSLPYSKGEFFLNPNPPFHFSLIRYLKENGYYTTFFYGGDPSFGGYSNFLSHQNIDLIMTKFGRNFKQDLIREKSFTWGYPDGDLFRRSFEVLDSMKVSPRLDIYLTLSTHAPFTPPDVEHYRQRFEKRLIDLNLKPNVKRMVKIQKDIFETVLYTDHSLREFFNQYKKRADFDNTIFIITGDHAMPELNITYLSILGRYHVPLIVYSPMLKKPVWFQSVSSHLDITPSILAMLRSYGDFTIPAAGHWLGQGIDVTENFRSSRSLSFTYLNGLQPDYLDGEYFYSFDRLYHVLPGLKLHRVYDAKISERLRKEQEDYLTVTNEVALKNKVVPEDLFFGWNYIMEPYHAATATEFNKTKSSDKYISLISYNKMSDDPVLLKIDLSILMKITSGDSTGIPLLVFNVLDDNVQNLKWVDFKLERKNIPGDFYRLFLKKYIDLSSIRDISSKTLKIYILNEKKEEIILDSLNLQLTSFKRKNIQNASPGE